MWRGLRCARFASMATRESWRRPVKCSRKKKSWRRALHSRLVSRWTTVYVISRQCPVSPIIRWRMRMLLKCKYEGTRVNNGSVGMLIILRLDFNWLRCFSQSQQVITSVVFVLVYVTLEHLWRLFLQPVFVSMTFKMSTVDFYFFAVVCA